MLQQKRNILIPTRILFGAAAATLGLFGSASAEEAPSSLRAREYHGELCQHHGTHEGG